MKKSDRTLGAVSLVLGAAFIWGATRIETGFIVDPLGPQTFPVIIGAVLILGALAVLVRPDPEPAWPSVGKALEVAAALAVLIGYALVLERAGFVIATAAAASLLCWRLGGPPIRAAATGVGISVGIYVVFHLVLGLSLARGPLGF